MSDIATTLSAVAQEAVHQTTDRYTVVLNVLPFGIEVQVSTDHLHPDQWPSRVFEWDRINLDDMVRAITIMTDEVACIQLTL